MASRRLSIATVLAVAIWILCGVYATQFVYRGWIAHDEGTIGQSAERVLNGDVPHRDFDEVYTGGLTYLHAAGMRLFGVSLQTPRKIVFAFFMAFLVAVYAIGRRVSSPGGALVAMAVAAVWSLPNYFVGLPSWYNLFFATFGVLAFLHYLETGHRRWLVIAGACGGLSVLAKISGLFYLAGGLLFLAYLEQEQNIGTPASRARRLPFWPMVTVPLAIVIFMLFRMLLMRSTAGAVEVFFPATAVCLFIAWREWARSGSSTVSERARRLLSLVWPFAAGAALPILAFVLYFWREHAIVELIQGVLVLPQRRLVEASSNAPGVAALLLGLPYVVLLLAGWRRSVSQERVLAGILVLLLGALLVLGNNPVVYRAIWAAARAMPLVAVIAGVVIVSRGEGRGTAGAIAPSMEARVFLLVTMAAMVAVVQFPYPTPTYFCYGAPMTVLAIVAVVFAEPKPSRQSHLTVATFFFLFATLFINRSYGWNLGVKFLPYSPGSQLELPRGGLWVPEDDERTYGEVVRVLQQHAAGGTIYAGPDCPEVYFLSGFLNPTRAVFEFLTPVRQDEDWMANLLSDGSVRAAVVNTAPLFSPRLSPGVLALLERRFPNSRRIGRFVVRFD